MRLDMISCSPERQKSRLDVGAAGAWNMISCSLQGLKCLLDGGRLGLRCPIPCSPQRAIFRVDAGTALVRSRDFSPRQRPVTRVDVGASGVRNWNLSPRQSPNLLVDVGAERGSRGIWSILTRHSSSYQFFGLFRRSRLLLPAQSSSHKVSVWSIAAPPRISYQFCWSMARTHPLPHQISADSRRGGAMGCWCISDVTQI